MSNEAGIAELVQEIKTTREDIAKADDERMKVLDEMKADIKKHGQLSVDTEAKVIKITDDMTANATKWQSLEDSLNDLRKRLLRPGPEPTNDDANRKAAVGLLRLKHELKIVKKDPDHPFTCTEEQIAEACTAVKAMTELMNTTNIDNLTPEYRKALTAFSFGSNGFILSPEMSNQVLSCLTDQTDVAGLMRSMTTAAPSVKFMINNLRIDYAAWACETTCFANNPQADLSGLGEMEIKPETLRYIFCATRDALEDASINMESLMISLVNQAFRRTISTAIMTGDGVGKPIGILHPNAGIAICDTALATPVDRFTWQDMIALKFQVPMQYHIGGRYLLNQNTLALLLTMSDAAGRPLLATFPQDVQSGPFLFNGSPLQIVTQMPDVAPGTTPIAFGNWNEVYMVVNRKAVTMQQDPYSAGFCILYKFEARVGGGIFCPNAARLLRIR